MTTIDVKTKRQRIRTFLAGTLASIIATLCSQPFEVIKVNQQIGHVHAVKQLEGKEPNKVLKYDSILVIIRKVFKMNGLRGFWQGHSTTQLLGVLHGITLFCTYEELRRYFAKTSLKNHKYKIIYISGFLSGTCSVILFSPVDLINTRKIRVTSAPISLYEHYKKILRSDGISGLYRGAFVNWVQVSNLVGLRFYVYNVLCAYVGDNNIYDNKIKLSTSTLIGCGAVSGIIASLLTFPLEVIKRRIQMHTETEKECFKIRSCIKYISKNEGPRGFYKGIIPSMLKSCVITAIVFSCYDKFSVFIKYGLREE